VAFFDPKVIQEAILLNSLSASTVRVWIMHNGLGQKQCPNHCLP